MESASFTDAAASLWCEAGGENVSSPGVWANLFSGYDLYQLRDRLEAGLGILRRHRSTPSDWSVGAVLQPENQSRFDIDHSGRDSGLRARLDEPQVFLRKSATVSHCRGGKRPAMRMIDFLILSSIINQVVKIGKI